MTAPQEIRVWAPHGVLHAERRSTIVGPNPRDNPASSPAALLEIAGQGFGLLGGDIALAVTPFGEETFRVDVVTGESLDAVALAAQGIAALHSSGVYRVWPATGAAEAA